MSKKTNRKIVSAGLMAALFIGALDVTVVSTAVPRIIQDLSGLSLISWVFSIYTLTTCVATPIFGKLTDLFGRRPVFAAGLILFVLGSVLCGMAQSMVALICFRAVQGIGAGALNPVVFTIIGDLYTGQERGRMQGLFSSVWSVAGLLGPLVGGYFVDHVSWRWIFYMNVPVGVVSLLLVLGFLHERIEKAAKSIDYSGAVTFTVGVSALLYALLNGGEAHPWNSAVILSSFAAAALFIALFLYSESKAKEPMMPLSLFRNRAMAISNASGFLAFCVSTGVTIYMPMWIQTLLGHSATSSGLTLLPMSLAWFTAANVSGRLMYRLGVKTFVWAGGLVVVGAGIWLWMLHLASPYWHIAGIMVAIGFGMGCISTPTTVLIQSAVGWQMRGVATATNSLMRSLGQTVGVAMFGTLFNSAVTDNSSAALAQGIHMVFAAIFVIALLHFAVTWFLPSNRQLAGSQITDRQAG